MPDRRHTASNITTSLCFYSESGFHGPNLQQNERFGTTRLGLLRLDADLVKSRMDVRLSSKADLATKNGHTIPENCMGMFWDDLLGKLDVHLWFHATDYVHIALTWACTDHSRDVVVARLAQANFWTTLSIKVDLSAIWTRLAQSILNGAIDQSRLSCDPDGSWICGQTRSDCKTRNTKCRCRATWGVSDV